MIDSELIKTLMTNILGAGYNSETGEIIFTSEFVGNAVFAQYSYAPFGPAYRSV